MTGLVYGFLAGVYVTVTLFVALAWGTAPGKNPLLWERISVGLLWPLFVVYGVMEEL